MKKLLILLASTVLLTSGLVSQASASVDSSGRAPRAAASAQAPRTVCQDGGDRGWRRCWTMLESRTKLTVVEAITLENATRRTKTDMHCSFSRSVSRSVTTGGSVSASAEFSVFKVVKANVTVTVHRDVTQTAEQASSAGGDITLRPGQSVVCQRTYGYVWARVRQTTWSGGASEVKIIKAKIPSNLGVRITD